MQLKCYFLIVDYNLSRIDEVAFMAEYVRMRYQLEIILIRANPSESDYQLTNHVVGVSPRDEHFTEKCLEALDPYKSRIASGIVFSDDAVHKGAVLLKLLGVASDDPYKAVNAFSKLSYRQAEEKLQRKCYYDWLFCPDYQVITSKQDLSLFWGKHPAGIVVKPTSEGNNRGVILLRQSSDITAAYSQVASHVKKGLMAEEKIPFQQEYSFDGVGMLSFITEKLSMDSIYPVEWGQVLPASLTLDEKMALEHAGTFANHIVGQRVGAFHNEIRLCKDTLRCAIVEPNRRPAGMQIWKLAERVYGVNLYRYWIDSLLDTSVSVALSKPQGQGGILMLPAKKAGILFYSAQSRAQVTRQLDRIIDQHFPEISGEYEWFYFSWTKESGCYVSNTVKHNGDFILQLGFFTSKHTILLPELFKTLFENWSSEEYVL